MSKTFEESKKWVRKQQDAEYEIAWRTESRVHQVRIDLGRRKGIGWAHEEEVAFEEALKDARGER